MILLLSNDEDVTTDLVVRELSALSQSVLRLNTNRLGESDYLSIRCGAQPDVVLRQDGRSFRLNDCRVVYYRRPAPPALPEINEPGIRAFAQREYRELTHNLCQLLDAAWINHPRAIRQADAKGAQLCLAARLGFPIPVTVVGNDPAQARQLVGDSRNGAVSKVLYSGLARVGDFDYHAYAEPVGLSDIANDALRSAPAIIQERVLKKADLRVTVIGNKVFSALIEGVSDAPLDWRKSPTVHYSVWKNSADFEWSCIALTRDLGLVYAALDFAVDESGQPWFLEANPSGQWAWIELETGLPVARAIAGALVEAAQPGVAPDGASRRR